jgi:DNA mismatch repair ATPase MutS
VGMRLEDADDDREQIIHWMKKPGEFGRRWFTFLMFAIPPVSVLMIVLLAAGTVSFQLFTFYLLVPLGLAFSQSKKIGSNHEMLGKKAGMLKKYGMLIKMIEGEVFKADSLDELKRSLTREHQAGQALRKLARIIQAFDTRLNIFGWIILNYFVPYDILQARRLENWRNQFSSHAGEWFDILAQFDALISLSNLWYNRPEFILPEPVDGDFVLHGENCGHPLLSAKSRVDNPVFFDDLQQFIIITGANMAGKSTYLRTVAVNYILAMAGAPVCASGFRFTPAGIFTSLRTSDNLLQSESYFFAELKRLKNIIDKLQAGEKLFIVLDEILKGTNSRDKQEGSKALLRQLIRYDAAGLIATHDLSLGDLINDYPKNIRNKRFEVEIVNDELVFDYRLKEGISQNLNASFLMKKMGITG